MMILTGIAGRSALAWGHGANDPGRLRRALARFVSGNAGNGFAGLN